MVNSRAKGIRFELATRDFFRRWFPEAERSFGQSRRGSDAPDVSGTPFWIECKHYGKKITNGMIIKWLETANDDAPDPHKQKIILRYKQNKGDVLYAMWTSELNGLEVDAKYHNGNIEKKIIAVDFTYNIPEQYISGLLDFAYGVSNESK